MCQAPGLHRLAVGLLDAPAAQLLDRHGGEGDSAALPVLGLLLADGASVRLLGAGDHRQLAIVEVDRTPAQGRDLAAAQPAQRPQNERSALTSPTLRAERLATSL